MDLFLAFLLEFLCEVLLQVVGELIVHLLLTNTDGEKTKTPYFLIYGFAGGGFGLLSLLYRHHIISNPTLRIVALGLLPLTVGILYALFNHYIATGSPKKSTWNNFLNGACFAFCFTLVRYFLAI